MTKLSRRNAGKTEKPRATLLHPETGMTKQVGVATGAFVGILVTDLRFSDILGPGSARRINRCSNIGCHTAL